MSLERKSTHVRLLPERHKQLQMMAKFQDRKAADLAAHFLDKMIVAEFHVFTLTADRFEGLGLSGKVRDK